MPEKPIYRYDMGNIQDVDTIIVGQGIAGSLLAWSLTKKEQRIAVIHDPTKHSASRVAAGVVNPVTGQRLVLQNNIEDFQSAARKLYRDLAQAFGEDFYIAKPMIRLARNTAESKSYFQRLNDPAYLPFLQALPTENPVRQELCFNEKQQIWLQQHTGYLRMNPLLDALRSYFRKQHVYVEASVNYADIQITDKQTHPVSWNNIKARKLIFCEGYLMQENPWFNWLPMQAAKGEILTLQRKTPLPSFMLHSGHWLLPTDAHTCKIGASYEPKSHSLSISEDVKSMLLKAVISWFPGIRDGQVTMHQAGIRPGSRDKHPFIGWHPAHTMLGIFNGFGSRGSLLVPWYAEAFSHAITKNAPIPEQADIRRFAPLPTNSKRPARVTLTTQAQQRLSVILKPGCIAVDATAGNGHDTAFLARQAGPDGYVYAFDIQPQAIANAQKAIEQLAHSDGNIAPVQFVQHSHADLLQHLALEHIGRVSVIMFNLGYLPGSDKSVITHAESTLQALEASLLALTPNGTLSIMVYPGHQGGSDEANAVMAWSSTLKAHFPGISIEYISSNKAHAPQLISIKK